MIKIVMAVAAAVIGSSMMASSVIAGPATESLAACLADNTTGKDRKDLARWIYAGMSIHPELRNLSNITNQNREELDKKMADMFTRLITESCPAQAKLTMDKEGAEGYQTAFGTIGSLAMQELMSNPEVDSSFKNFVKYIDYNKINSVFEKK